MIIIPENIKTALNILENGGYEAYLVGGAVRSLLLDQKINDFDVTTNADPNAIKMLFSSYRVYDIGKKFGTIRVLIGNDEIEITPFRSEGKYLDHRHPEEIFFTGSLKDDLKRRDFTINAMCLDQRDELIDYFGGLDDLNNRLIRCIGNPESRFNEDGLRILRALRFSSKLNFRIEEKTRDALFSSKHLLSYISAERKNDELLKILDNENAFAIINEYLPIFNEFVPFGHVERKINDFSNNMFALAYLLIDKDVDLLELRYSKRQSELINALKHSAKIDIYDDYEFICALSSINEKQILQFLEEYHHIDLENRYEELKDYITDISNLRITGEQIGSFGYTANQITQVKNMLLEKVHQKQIRNDETSLLKNIEGIIL